MICTALEQDLPPSPEHALRPSDRQEPTPERAEEEVLETLDWLRERYEALGVT